MNIIDPHAQMPSIHGTPHVVPEDRSHAGGDRFARQNEDENRKFEEHAEQQRRLRQRQMQRR